MKSLTFDKNSWHFYFASRLAGYRVLYYNDYLGFDIGDKADICTYLTYVMKGFLILALTFAAIYVVGYLFFEMAFSIGFSLYYHMNLFSEVGLLLIAITSICSIFGTFVYLVIKFVNWLSNKRNNMIEHTPKVDGFIKNAYKSWKQKFCVQINFIGETK